VDSSPNSHVPAAPVHQLPALITEAAQLQQERARLQQEIHALLSTATVFLDTTEAARLQQECARLRQEIHALLSTAPVFLDTQVSQGEWPMHGEFWRTCVLAVGIALLTGVLLGLFLCWWWGWL
jgi:hypothetical protein